MTELNEQSQNFRFFAEHHPEEAAWILENASWSRFAINMRSKINKGSTPLTENMMNALKNAASKPSQKPIYLGSVLTAFAHARDSGLKKPKLRLPAFTFSMAPNKGMNAGWYYVVREDGQYLGKISTEGNFHPNREFDIEVDGTKLEALANADLPALARQYGIETGNCSCCGRELTDQKSIEAGIGPVCATKWGM